ncbi:MAG: hypothetical protein AAF821_16490 [Cyanobacteria bacterium P01_D01_bin.156]
MQPLIWIVFALTMVALGYRLYRQDEVHAIALYIIGLLSGMWGFSLVPSALQLTMGAVAIGWLQLSALRK